MVNIMKNVKSAIASVITILAASTATAGTVNDKIGLNGIAYDVHQAAEQVAVQNTASFPEQLFVSDK